MLKYVIGPCTLASLTIWANASNVGDMHNAVDKRLDGMDQRLDGVYARFTDVDRRFDQVDMKLERLERWVYVDMKSLLDDCVKSKKD